MTEEKRTKIKEIMAGIIKWERIDAVHKHDFHGLDELINCMPDLTNKEIEEVVGKEDLVKLAGFINLGDRQ